MSDKIVEFGSLRRPPHDAIVDDSLELLRIFHRATDPAQRRAIIRMLDHMLPDCADVNACDGVYPP